MKKVVFYLVFVDGEFFVRCLGWEGEVTDVNR